MTRSDRPDEAKCAEVAERVHSGWRSLVQESPSPEEAVEELETAIQELEGQQ